MKPLFQEFGVESLNILVIGPSKCGKSAFLNSIKTALEKKYFHIEESKVSTVSNSAIAKINAFPLNL